MTRRSSLLIACLALVALVLSGCASSGAGGSGDSDTADGDTGGDVRSPDADDDPDDTGDDDTGVLLDTGDLGMVEDVDPGLGPGERCVADDDCADGLCIDVVLGAEAGICASQCTDDTDCQMGFECVFLGGGGVDNIQVCLATDLCIDEDDDGFGFGPGCDGPDCDDEDPRANPAQEEECDQVDNDCDGMVDDNPVGVNDDCDTGFDGVCATGRTVCEAGLFVCEQRAEPGDETCNNVDDDCDGLIDEDELDEPIARDCYDGPEELLGIGACVGGQQLCMAGGFSGCIGQVLPGTEVCDGEDNDCDGETDEGATAIPWYPDEDGDGFGATGGEAVVQCAPPAGYADNDLDCDDTSALAFPGGMEAPGDEIDGNCDGSELCYTDDDADGVRGDSITISDDIDCTDEGEATDEGRVPDCDDDDPTSYPGAEEVIGDGADNDCDGFELCWVDGDNDGYHDNDFDPSVDADCSDPGEADADAPNEDCDDDEPLANPGQLELCDEIDNDCDLSIDEGAGCFAIGEPCSEHADCASGFCDEDGFCAEADGCPGCPNRTGLHAGGGTVATDNYTMTIELGSALHTHERSSTNYRIRVGLGVHVQNP